MNLLVVNFEMDDGGPVLAWQASVVRELAPYCNEVIVLTERLGAVKIPANVSVIPMPRFAVGPPRKLGTGLLLNALVRRLIRERSIDVCFVHMAHEWVRRLYPSLRLGRVPILVWYAHGSTSWRLWLTERLASRIVTSTPDGFRLPSEKVAVIGQGIDTDLFVPPDLPIAGSSLVYVGRISPRKRIDVLVESMAMVVERGGDVELQLIGPSVGRRDVDYQTELERRATALGLRERIRFVGSLTQREIVSAYDGAFLHINVSETGSMDKTVLEALACGCPVLTSNPAFRELLAPFPEFRLESTRPDVIADQVASIRSSLDRYDRDKIRALVLGRHDVHSYAARVADQLRLIQRAT